jgi:hypothetical protein
MVHRPFWAHQHAGIRHGVLLLVNSHYIAIRYSCCNLAIAAPCFCPIHPLDCADPRKLVNTVYNSRKEPVIQVHDIMRDAKSTYPYGVPEVDYR